MSKSKGPKREWIPVTPPRKKIPVNPPRETIPVTPPRKKIPVNPPRETIPVTPPRKAVSPDTDAGQTRPQIFTTAANAHKVTGPKYPKDAEHDRELLGYNASEGDVDKDVIHHEHDMGFHEESVVGPNPEHPHCDKCQGSE